LFYHNIISFPTSGYNCSCSSCYIIYRSIWRSSRSRLHYIMIIIISSHTYYRKLCMLHYTSIIYYYMFPIHGTTQRPASLCDGASRYRNIILSLLLYRVLCHVKVKIYFVRNLQNLHLIRVPTLSYFVASRCFEFRLIHTSHRNIWNPTTAAVGAYNIGIPIFQMFTKVYFMNNLWIDPVFSFWVECLLRLLLNHYIVR